MTMIALATIIISCEKDEDLISEISSLAEDDPGLDNQSTEWDLLAGEEEAEAASDSEMSPQVGLRSSTKRIFRQTKFLRKGQKYQVYIKKRYLHSEYKYVCKVTPSSGDPDLYILGRQTSRNRWRLIRKAEFPGGATAESYGRRSDLSESEDRLYFLIKARESGQFKIEIFKVKSGQEVECIDYRDDFEQRLPGPIAEQSARWISFLRDDPDPKNSALVRDNPYGSGRILELHYRGRIGVFKFGGPWRSGIYRMKMDLYFEPGSEFEADFYADYQGGSPLVNVQIGKDMADIGQDQVCVRRSARTPRSQGWVEVEILYDASDKLMTIKLDKGRVEVSRRISLDEPLRYVAFDADRVDTGQGWVLMDNLAIDVLSGCD